MKKSTARLIIIAVIVTILLNVILISMSFIKTSPQSRRTPPPIEQINEFIISEMEYDSDQARRFKSVASQHHENQRQHQARYREIKRRLNRAMLNQNKKEVDKLMNDLTKVVKDKEMELYKFFSEIQEISSPEQMRRFGRIFREATGAPEYERNPMDGEGARFPRPPKH